MAFQMVQQGESGGLGTSEKVIGRALSHGARRAIARWCEKMAAARNARRKHTRCVTFSLMPNCVTRAWINRPSLAMDTSLVSGHRSGTVRNKKRAGTCRAGDKLRALGQLESGVDNDCNNSLAGFWGREI